MGKFEKLTNFDRQVINWINETSKGHSKECILSAVNHLKKAFELKSIDPEIAIFRCITAEEEVARGIFIVLKEHNYKNMDKIKDKDHKYKQALDLFIKIIQNYFASFSENINFPQEFQLVLNYDKKVLEIAFSINNNDELLKPVPPLNFSMIVNDKAYYFKNELEELAKNNRKKILNQIEEKANFRNKIIYAEPKGTLQYNGSIDTELDQYYNRVFGLIRVYSLIYPYKNNKSEFIQNTIDAFVFMMMDLEI